jgi:hypothetical protein
MRSLPAWQHGMLDSTSGGFTTNIQVAPPELHSNGIIKGSSLRQVVYRGIAVHQPLSVWTEQAHCKNQEVDLLGSCLHGCRPECAVVPHLYSLWQQRHNMTIQSIVLKAVHASRKRRRKFAHRAAASQYVPCKQVSKATTARSRHHCTHCAVPHDVCIHTYLDGSTDDQT